MDKGTLYYIVGRAICRNEFLECIQTLGAELDTLLPEDEACEDEKIEEKNNSADNEEETEDTEDTEDLECEEDAGNGRKNKISDEVITNILSTVVAEKQYSWKDLIKIAQVPRSTLHRMLNGCKRDSIYADGVNIVKFRGSDIISYITTADKA
jgi:hypothetical protein